MPPSPGHFWANSVTAAPCGQKKQARANSHSHSVTGPEAEIAGIRFRLATATTKSNTRSRRPRTRSRPGFLPVGRGRMALPSNIGARKHGSLSIAHGVGDGEAPWFPALPGQIVQRTFLEVNHMPVEYVGFMLKPMTSWLLIRPWRWPRSQ